MQSTTTVSTNETPLFTPVVVSTVETVVISSTSVPISAVESGEKEDKSSQEGSITIGKKYIGVLFFGFVLTTSLYSTRTSVYYRRFNGRTRR